MKKLAICLCLLLLLSACAGEKEAPAQAPQNDFQELLVLENDSCAVKITGLQPETLFGYGVNVYLENKTGDKSLMFTCDTGSVNGVQIFPLLAAEVSPGKKANDCVTFRAQLPQGESLGEVTDIALSFRVYDSQDILADDIATASVHIYPQGQDKATRFTRTPKPSDTVLVEDENLRVLVTGYRMDEIWGYCAQLYLENKTQTPLMVSVEDASVNGFMLDPFFATVVAPGACAFQDVAWAEESLLANGIASVREIQFELEAYPADDIFAENILDLEITLNP